MVLKNGQIFHQCLTNLQVAVCFQLPCASSILRLHQQQQIKFWASFAKEQKCNVEYCWVIIVSNKEFSQHTCSCWLIWICARPNDSRGNCASVVTVCLRQDKIVQKVMFLQKLAHHFRNSGIQIVVGQTEIFILMQKFNCSKFVPGYQWVTILAHPPD